jgi:hypothetical protein
MKKKLCCGVQKFIEREKIIFNYMMNWIFSTDFVDVEGTISSNDNWNGTDESNAYKIIITYIQIY